jgi:ATP-binding cassette subfamily B protein
MYHGRSSTAKSVASTQTKSFERVFRTKYLFQGSARSALIWSSFASFLLILLLADLFFIADLLESRGQVTLPGDQTAEFTRTMGLEPLSARTDNLGLGVTVWKSRDRVWGEVVGELYRNVPLLQENGSALALLVLMSVVLGFVRSLMLGRAARLSNRTGLDAVTRLRRAVHRQTLRLGPGNLQTADNEHVLELFTTQMNRVHNGVTCWVYRWGRNPLELFLLLAVAVSFQWRVSLQCLIPFGFCWYFLQRENQRFQVARQLAESRVNAQLSLLGEGLRKTRIVRGYGMEDFEHQQFNNYLDRFRDNLSQVNRLERWSLWVGKALVMICISIVLLLVGIKVILPVDVPSSLSLASAFILMATFFYMLHPLEMLWNVTKERNEASLAADKIYRYLDQIPEVSQAVGAKFLQPLEKTLQFESVSYLLPDKKKLLNNLDLKLPAETTTAVVSLDPLESRCLAYLLPRFLEPHSGRILFDGEDIGWVTLESLRAETVYVGGLDPFFTGSVRDNISCGNAEYSLQAITEAAKTTHANNFILTLQQGYETVLGEHGEQLNESAGFRLGLARAMLRNPALMIIEEPEAPLDDDTKALLEDAYNRIVKDRTVVFLPSRLSTVKRVDRIVLLHQGKVEAIGNHTQLLKSSPLYRHWEYMRFNEFRYDEE